MLRHSFAWERYRSVIISCLVSARNSRLRPGFVALSVLVGVASAASGMLASRGSGDEHLQVALTDTNYQPSTVPHPPPTAPNSSATTTAPTTTPASPEPSTPSSPPSSETSTPKPPPSTSDKAPAPVVAPDSSLAAQVLALVNQQRANAGCGALTADSRLGTAAQKFSEDMSARNYFSHTTPDGVTFDQRIKAAGYPSPAAENIAKGSTTAAKTMDMWMNSDGHRRNILNCSYQKLGVGLARSGWYWVQDFGF